MISFHLIFLIILSMNPQNRKRRVTYTFDTYLKILKKYKGDKGNLIIPKNYSVRVQKETIFIGRWLSNMRTAYKRMKDGEKDTGKRYVYWCIKKIKIMVFLISF